MVVTAPLFPHKFTASPIPVREKLEEYRFKKAALLWPFRRSRIEHLVFLPERANKTKNPNNPVNPAYPPRG